MDSIEIGCTDSPTLRLRTCKQPIVFQPLRAHNRYCFSTLSPEFTVLLDQGVQERMALLNEKYKQFSANYKELR